MELLRSWSGTAGEGCGGLAMTLVFSFWWRWWQQRISKLLQIGQLEDGGNGLTTTILVHQQLMQAAVVVLE
jgi:hypothetical protein